MIGVGLAISLTNGVRRTTGIALNGSGTVDITVGNGAIMITVSDADYAHHNGTHGPFATSDLDTGPISVVPPLITGTPGTGVVLTSVPGLWMFDSGDTATITATWQRDGVDIAGATGTTYTTVAADEGRNVTYRETATNSAGARTADSNVIGIPTGSVLNAIGAAIGAENLVVFLDFTDFSVLWAANDLTGAVAAPGDSVNSITDGSNSANHFKVQSAGPMIAQTGYVDVSGAQIIPSANLAGLAAGMEVFSVIDTQSDAFFLLAGAYLDNSYGLAIGQSSAATAPNAGVGWTAATAEIDTIAQGTRNDVYTTCNVPGYQVLSAYPVDMNQPNMDARLSPFSYNTSVIRLDGYVKYWVLTHTLTAQQRLDVYNILAAET